MRNPIYEIEFENSGLKNRISKSSLDVEVQNLVLKSSFKIPSPNPVSKAGSKIGFQMPLFGIPFSETPFPEFCFLKHRFWEFRFGRRIGNWGSDGVAPNHRPDVFFRASQIELPNPKLPIRNRCLDPQNQNPEITA
ncbi:hypothetical protein [Thalassospira lucentensis]|uniref:hypothetical protein n=1 Tax=Thalassospira lucentensis TaxID=168935 RepID=UPI003AA82178